MPERCRLPEIAVEAEPLRVVHRPLSCKLTGDINQADTTCNNGHGAADLFGGAMNHSCRRNQSLRAIAVFFTSILVVTLAAMPAMGATPSVTLTPNVDPPSPGAGPPVMFQVAGSNFPASTAINIYFDTTDVALAVSSSTGSFSGINVQVPSTAVPGTTG